MPNRAALPPTSNGYNDLYSSNYEDDSLFEEMVDSNPIIKTNNTYIVVPPKLTLVNPPPKMINKQREIRIRKRLATIQQAQSDTIASARFL